MNVVVIRNDVEVVIDKNTESEVLKYFVNKGKLLKYL